MKTLPMLAALMFTLLARAQGPLTPPTIAGPEIGPLAATSIFGPQATMKTLHQVEPRTPIASLPYTISFPGSYYLTRNLTVASGDGITITADGVDLDLSGFSLFTSSPTPSGTAILLTNTVGMVRIANGNIRGLLSASGGGWNYGILANGVVGDGFAARVDQVTVVGCALGGIILSGETGPSLVTDCLVRHCRDAVLGPVAGLAATRVRDCVVYDAEYGVVASVATGVVATECQYGFALSGVVANSTGVGREGGIFADVVQGSFALATEAGGEGVRAPIVQGTYGAGPFAGIKSSVVSSSFGKSLANTGILGDGAVMGSYAQGVGPASALVAKTALGNFVNGSGSGLALTTMVAVGNYAETSLGTAVDTYVSLANYGISGGSGTGVDASVIGSSYGQSRNGNGLYASRAVQNSYGRADGLGIGLRGGVVQNAIGASVSGTDLQAIYSQQNSAVE
jgi:hypothetical protein